MTKDLNALISKNELAQERFKDLEEYFGGSRSILEDRKEFKKWLERGMQNAKKVDELESKLEQQTSDDVMAIHTQGLDEGIRCAMCTNSMKSDRGCDGGCVVNEDMYKKIMDTIKNHIVPPVTPTQRWIPVSEELPKDRDWYLGIFREHDTGWINLLPFVCDYVGKETKATTKEFWILRGFTDIDIPCDYYKNLECVAWQPLPKPYEEKRGSENESIN